MRIVVSNYRSCEAADIHLTPLALVGGMNGNGKTSLVRAFRAALTQEPVLPDERAAGITKLNAQRLVTIGAAAGKVELVADSGEAIAIEYPKCVITANSSGAPRSSSLASGLIDFASINRIDRARLIGGYIDGIPAVEELQSAMEEIGYKQSTIDAMWKNIIDEGVKTWSDGWDASHFKVVEHGKTLKGQWREAANNETWGSTKSEAWKHPGMAGIAASEDEATLADDLDRAERAVEGAQKAAGRDEAILDGWRADVSAGQAIDVEKLRAAATAARERRTKALDARDATPRPEDQALELECPHCHERSGLRIERVAASTKYSLAMLAKPLSDAERQAMRENRIRVESEVSNSELDLSAAQNTLTNGQRIVEKGIRARASLATVEKENNAAGGADVARAKLERDLCKSRLNAYTKTKRAATLHRQILMNVKLIDLLAIDGLRRRKLERGLAVLNSRLADLCTIAKWGLVALSNELDATYRDSRGTWLYTECSDGHQLRVRATLKVAFAEIDKSDAIAIDRAETADKDGMNGLLRLLKAANG